MTEKNEKQNNKVSFVRNSLTYGLFLLTLITGFFLYKQYFFYKKNNIITKKICSMNSYKGGHSSILLKNNDVLLLCNYCGYNIIEQFIYTKSKFVIINNNFDCCRFCSPVYISDKNILIFGKDILKYDSITKKFEKIYQNYNRFNCILLKLSDGNILIFGGRNNNNEIIETLDIFSTTKNKIISSGKLFSEKYTIDLKKEKNNLIQISNNEILIIFDDFIQIYDIAKCKVVRTCHLENIEVENLLNKIDGQKILISYRNKNNKEFLNIGILNLQNFFIDFLAKKKLVLGYKTVMTKNNSIYFIGTSNKYNNKGIYVYHYKNNEFKFLGNMHHNRIGHDCILLNNNQILITGGTEDDFLPNSTNTVEKLIIKE